MLVFSSYGAFKLHNSIRQFWASVCVCACSDIFWHFACYYYSNSIDGTCPASATDVTFVKPRRIWPVLTCILTSGLKRLLKLELTNVQHLFVYYHVLLKISDVYIRDIHWKNLNQVPWALIWYMPERFWEILIKLTHVWDHLSYWQALYPWVGRHIGTCADVCMNIK